MHRTWSLPRRALALVLAASLVGCASTTTIRSTPSGATVYVEDRRVGTTPLIYADRKTSFSWVKLRLEKEGYAPVEAVMRRDGSLNFGALFFGALIFPLFWMMGYPDEHSYALEPATDPEALDWEKRDTDDLY
ncbi:PEGA domain-containing protein [Pyxidicoccus trucidator]|uniref:PEGA domain-containing protein n=1 Tax=Pyxidicoccus trucidator TaxID=2709662 RepID=UPI0013DB18BE|nr:PEGA domain-containing protein [Pyxidicoccus trucidator]